MGFHSQPAKPEQGIQDPFDGFHAEALQAAVSFNLVRGRENRARSESETPSVVSARSILHNFAARTPFNQPSAAREAVNSPASTAVPLPSFLPGKEIPMTYTGTLIADLTSTVERVESARLCESCEFTLHKGAQGYVSLGSSDTSPPCTPSLAALNVLETNRSLLPDRRIINVPSSS